MSPPSWTSLPSPSPSPNSRLLQSPHSSILAWRIPRTKEPGRQTIVHRVVKSWTQLKWLSMHAYVCVCVYKYIQMGLSFLFSFVFHFFSQLFVRPPQTAILLFCIPFSWGWSWSLSPVQCHEPLSIVHQALCLSDLIPWIYFSLTLYNRKGCDLGHSWMVQWFSLLSSI